tara:strand:+ start:1042 stop:1806 length:765 start_codon:yes stop_codon:yes gene_type:complete
MKYLILIIFGFFLLHFLNSRNTESLDNLKKFKITKYRLLKKLSDGMIITHKVFKKHNIFYQISFGSLLGAIRHKKIIPWDDDADLLIHRKDINKILNLKNEFNKHGWTVEKNWKLLKIKPIDDSGNVKEEPFIDLFIIDTVSENENGKMVEKVVRCLTKTNKCKILPRNHGWWNNWFYFPSKYISGRKEYRFKDNKIGYDFVMFGPTDGDKILKFWYGDDCLINCQSPIYDHTTGKYLKSKKIKCSILKEKFNI